MIREVWKLNVSTVLILPIFNGITKELLLRGKNVTFTQLCFMYKMQKCYITKKLQELALVFYKDISAKRLVGTNMNFWSFNELMITREGFSKFEMYNDYIIFYLKINPCFADDVKLITSGDYSKVSDMFRTEIDTLKHFKRLEKTETLADDLCVLNIPRAIVDKENYMKDMIEDQLKVKLRDETEYFNKFISREEILNLSSLR